MVREMTSGSSIEEIPSSSYALFFAAPLMTAAAAAMGWGIRGQYGHEWGAMVPGVLVGFVLVFLFSKRSTSLHAARAIALTAVAFSFGGVMTYGQTVGLTHDSTLVGNNEAYRWGMLGLYLKGGLWVGFGGAFLGLGLSEKKYGWKEFLLLYIGLLVLVFIGIQLLNRPYVPGTDRQLSWFYFPQHATAERALPILYFSDHWEWEPDKTDIDPRPEIWGGLACSLAGLLTYFVCLKKDKLAANLTCFGFLGGGLGFSLGQSLQAKHAWTPGWLSGFDATLHKAIPGVFPEEFFSLMSWNWWNMMETTFGMVFGVVLGLGLWFNRNLISQGDAPDHVAFHPVVEWLMIALYAAMLYLWSVPRADVIDPIGNFPLAMGMIPVVGILGGRYWAYFLALPLVALPMAGITHKMVADDHVLTDRLLFLVLPMATMIAAAVWFQYRGRRGQSGRTFARYGLIISALVYFGLNFVVFDYPWGTLPTTSRNTNNWIFSRCVELLIFGALLLHRRHHRVIPTTD